MSWDHIIPPAIDERQIVELLVNNYEFSRTQISEVIRLNGYDDRNFKIVTNVPKAFKTGDGAQAYVLKITNLQDSQNIRMAEAQIDLLFFLDENGVKCPAPISTKTGAFYGMIDLETGKHLFKLTYFFDGMLLTEMAQSINENLCYQYGQHVATMDTLLKRFRSIAYKEHKTIWSLSAVPGLWQVLQEFKNNKDESGLTPNLLDEFEHILVTFDKKVLKRCADFTPSLIHGDCNEQNVIVQSAYADNKSRYQLTILDFGDAHYSYIIYDVAITLTYLLTTTLDLESAKHFLAGYRSILQLSDIELSVIPYCIYARLAQSVLLGVSASRYQSTNAAYIQISRKNILKLLDLMHRIPNADLIKLWTST